VRIGFRWGNLRERDNVGDLSIDEGIILKWDFNKLDGAWTGLIWFRIGTRSWLLVKAVMNLRVQ
jgi:hypothetical protein